MNKMSLDMLTDIEKEMKTESKLQHFERAAELRNQYFGLKGLKKKIVFSDKEFMDISSDQALKELQKLLNLPKPPRRIEGYDISHEQGTNVVASMVVFTNGVSDRSEYRKFKMHRQKNDDTGNMLETITRRLKHEEWPYPDLIILDGAEGQVNAVRGLLSEAHIPVLGRDKSGDHTKNAPVHIVIPDDKEPSGFRSVVFSPDSHVAKLIARIDDESHRFAITYHRLLKKKSLLS